MARKACAPNGARHGLGDYAWLVASKRVAILKNILCKQSGIAVTARCESFLTTFKNIPHEEVFRGCTIIGIFFDSCIA